MTFGLSRLGLFLLVLICCLQVIGLITAQYFPYHRHHSISDDSIIWDYRAIPNRKYRSIRSISHNKTMPRFRRFNFYQMQVTWPWWWTMG